MIPLIVPVSYPKRIPPKAAKAELAIVSIGGTRHEDGRNFRPAIRRGGIYETHCDRCRPRVMKGENTATYINFLKIRCGFPVYIPVMGNLFYNVMTRSRALSAGVCWPALHGL